jgi:hypothetical protein
MNPTENAFHHQAGIEVIAGPKSRLIQIDGEFKETEI